MTLIRFGRDEETQTIHILDAIGYVNEKKAKIIAKNTHILGHPIVYQELVEDKEFWES